jgi:beta-glucosidase
VTVSLSFDLVKGDAMFSYRDNSLATADRVADVPARMRLAEKVGQWYVRDLVTSVMWADTELKGFEKVPLGPGESVDVTLDLEVSACTIVDADADGVRVVEPGDFEVLVGPYSRNTSLLDARFAVVA